MLQYRDDVTGRYGTVPYIILTKILWEWSNKRTPHALVKPPGGLLLPPSHFLLQLERILVASVCTNNTSTFLRLAHTTLSLNMVQKVVPAPAFLTGGHKAAGLAGKAAAPNCPLHHPAARAHVLALVQRGHMAAQFLQAHRLVRADLTDEIQRRRRFVLGCPVLPQVPLRADIIAQIARKSGTVMLRDDVLLQIARRRRLVIAILAGESLPGMFGELVTLQVDGVGGPVVAAVAGIADTLVLGLLMLLEVVIGGAQIVAEVARIAETLVFGENVLFQVADHCGPIVALFAGIADLVVFGHFVGAQIFGGGRSIRTHITGIAHALVPRHFVLKI